MKLYIIIGKERAWVEGDNEGPPEILATFTDEDKAKDYYTTANNSWRAGGYPGDVIMFTVEDTNTVYYTL